MAIVTKTNTGNTIVTLSSLDADWSWSTVFPSHTNGIGVHSIQYIPSGLNDVCILKDYNGSVAISPEIFYVSSLCKFNIKYFDGNPLKLYYDISDTNACTASANAKIIVHFDSR